MHLVEQGIFPQSTLRHFREVKTPPAISPVKSPPDIDNTLELRRLELEAKKQERELELRFKELALDREREKERLDREREKERFDREVAEAERKDRFDLERLRIESGITAKEKLEQGGIASIRLLMLQNISGWYPCSKNSTWTNIFCILRKSPKI